MATAISPSTLNYFIGSGVVYFNRLDTAGNPTGELDLGNVPNFSITPSVESVKHYESRTALKELDKEIDTKIEYSIKFTLEEYSIENLKLVLGDGITTSKETQGNGNATDTITAKYNRWFKLTYRKISSVVVKKGAIIYVLGTDYLLDTTIGRVYFLSTGSIIENDEITVEYAYSSIEYPKVILAKSLPVEGSIRFVGDTNQGGIFEVELWKVKLNFKSEIKFITNEISSIEVEGTLYKDASKPAEPWGVLREIV